MGVADPAPVHHFSGLMPGRYLETWPRTVASTTTRPFTVNEHNAVDRAPWAVGAMDVLVAPYALDSEANTAVPWTNLGAVTAAVEVDGGRVVVDRYFAPGTAVVSVEERPFGQPVRLPAGVRAAGR